MIPIDTLAAFLTASILLALAPGPDNIFVLTQSAINGRSAGIFVILGLCTGLIVHSSAVALGVAVIFQRSATAFFILKMIGAGYLAYLAWQAFRASADQIPNESEKDLIPWKLYRRGVIMNITNPKVSIFFLAFLPQFADPLRGPVSMQILFLGGLFIIATLFVFSSIAFLAGSLGQWLNKSDRIQTTLNKIAGTVFLGLALKLATTKQ
ncbi:homoserine/threonine efflux protein (LysE-type family translocator) [Desulforapulum autotrophicum HRM2]|uniref:Homoserine/threonine efflux protein (LysE-type family translocator) n=1 Tax=Desulforapulum autotrophicum (strain ATCC 43914 / DSM 3382 / VKM B-1955 / HRM2) TaxID=177437 RepID=C0QEC7_DESAH|nr:LysE family translocator [Desulforapulum autotrophicum]ACN13244.1 homoserine/threonine efflux protein (LysE-type family translocator) [Desulforapulum autotrophicum HRM2]